MKNSIFNRTSRVRAKAASWKAKAFIKLAISLGLLAGLMMAFTHFNFTPSPSTAAAQLVIYPTPPPSQSPGRQRSGTQLLTGYVDMHTHPMAHLGFGKRLLHGAPDIGSLVPKGTHNCNESDFRAKTMNEALGSCNSIHGGYGLFDNPCGNTLRSTIINKAFDGDFVHKTDNVHGDHAHGGSPTFFYWPHQSSIAHQQMWVDWIKRAHGGGLRVMVALSVNNQLLAKAIDGDEPLNDKASSDLQITELKSFVGRHNDFMEVAYSATDLVRIVKANKLAVILGMEIDDFGGFNAIKDANWNLLTETTKKTLVKTEIKRLYDLGVRYMFPIHLTNNRFGGTAAFNILFNFASRYNTGSFLDVTYAADPSIQFDMGKLPDPALKDVLINVTSDLIWNIYAVMPTGHINKLGLTSLGEYALNEMMKLGIIIDLDHMGIRSMNRSLELAEGFNGGYPVNLGHNNLRNNTPSDPGSERNMDAATALRIGKLGGMIGVGAVNAVTGDWVAEYLNVANAMSNNGQFFVAPAIGTDANGAEKLPRGSQGLDPSTFYADGFTKCKTGERTWDYTKEGVAHYGLMSDFFRDMKNFRGQKGKTVNSRFRYSAEYFARMWEKCEDVAGID
jgi:microsomal dipeptidase-like Zn-dependent dipeptidase